MKTIKSIISKPSQALRAMCVGLMRQSKRPDFVVDMDAYGYIRDGFCFGCAATATLQEIAKKNLTVTNYHMSGTAMPFTRVQARSSALELDLQALFQFEGAMNCARLGDVSWLFSYFDCDRPDITVNFRLKTDNWKRELPKVYAYIKQLEALGL